MDTRRRSTAVFHSRRGGEEMYGTTASTSSTTVNQCLYHTGDGLPIGIWPERSGGGDVLLFDEEFWDGFDDATETARQALAEQ
jgi:hypothetical protein